MFGSFPAVSCTNNTFSIPPCDLPTVHFLGRAVWKDETPIIKPDLPSRFSIVLFRSEIEIVRGDHHRHTMAGDVALADGHCPLALRSSKGMDTVRVDFSYQKSARDESGVRLGWFYRPGAWRERIIMKFHGMYQYSAREHTNPAAQAMLEVTLQQVLMWISIHQRRYREPVHFPALQIREIIERDIAKQITADDVCRQAGLSYRAGANAFEREFGVSISRFIRRRRINIARYLIRTTDLPIGEIGARCGIPDPHYFNKVFRKETGMSPTAARRPSGER